MMVSQIEFALGALVRWDLGTVGVPFVLARNRPTCEQVTYAVHSICIKRFTSVPRKDCGLSELKMVDVSGPTRGVRIVAAAKHRKPSARLRKLAESAHASLSEELGIQPHVDVIVLSREEWSSRFGNQPYGDPVSPGGGQVYYGTEVPESWKDVVARFAMTPEERRRIGSLLTMEFFRRTLGHEMAHVFADALLNPATRERMERDFAAARLEILWFVEAFCQCAQLRWMQKKRDPQLAGWLEFYRWLFQVAGPLVPYPRLTDWGVGVLDLRRRDAQRGTDNYLWLQAKAFLMGESMTRRSGWNFLRTAGDLLRLTEYPIGSGQLVDLIDHRLEGFRPFFDAWNESRVLPIE